MQTLVLNIALTPVSIVPVRRAITLISSDKAIAVANYDDQFYRSSRLVMPVPSVIKCIKSDYIPRHYTNVWPFNRKNVYIRDNGCCMYCGKKVSLSDFTFDHVISQDDGGKTWWDNIVVSCFRCNGQKGNKKLNRYQRKLIRIPYVPKLSKAAPAHIVRRLESEIPHETWLDWVYWHVILQHTV
jgi:5-methylcytosine-specific restriction endonuclease McrA